jgi:hypothetical protein
MSLPELDASATTPLQAHFQQCSFAAGVRHRLRCVMEGIGGFVAPRIVSMLLAICFLGLMLQLPFGSP